jgi:chromosome segregation protein
MYLRSIILKGFKSFPDRTRLEFGPGVSVVVGPNGSGKSNVTDAVLWALGEQSPLAVRGQSMQDVIFGGVPGRQAASRAEVELVLDDSDGQLGLGVSEVSILRRLDRTGEGEYRIAGARCRLIDVIELLSDTGLGKEMHSVISQGRVESIVTSKPRERRLLIEEAAGLGKHRKRRRRAQLKLEHTQDNLDRALDVEREARSRLRPLKRQAEAAELHARLHRQLLEVRYELARDGLRGRLTELESAHAQADEARGACERVERELESVGARRQEAEEALAGRSSHREELSRRRFAAQSAGERVAYRREAVERAAITIAERVERMRERLERLLSEEAAQPADAGADARIEALERELGALDRDRRAELERQLAGLEGELAAAARREAERTQQVAGAQHERDRRQASLVEAQAASTEAERTVAEARREAARIGGELAAVNQFLSSLSSPRGGVRSLAEALTVAGGYELAVAAALDGRLTAALAADRESAAELLDEAGADGGRVLVIGALELGSASANGQEPSAPMRGAERLADLVHGEDDAAALARSLLHDAWLVGSLEQIDPSFSGVAVTREGRVWSAALGELRQAGAAGEERVLAQRNRREALVTDSGRAVGDEQRARAELERASARVADRERDYQQALGAYRTAGRERDEAAEDRRRAQASIARRRAAPDDGPDAGRTAQLRAELLAARGARDRDASQRSERSARIEQCRDQIERGERLGPLLEHVIEALGTVVEAIDERRAEFEAELAADREAGEQAAAALRAFAQQEAGLQSALHAGNERLTVLEVGAQRGRDRADEARHALDLLARELGFDGGPAPAPLDEHDRAALSARRERLERRREQLGPVNPLAQDEYAEAVEHVEELERQRTDLETALRELHKLIGETDRQIRLAFEQTFAAAAANFEDLAARLFPGGKGCLRLVAERERPAAVLGGAASPAASGEEADRAGGEAPEHDEDRDHPDDGEDLLGVEIEITPAGKSMKRLSLLSGGEKSMTAIAFLFSVFLARPCPFYILDEVEAALDDPNIDRFLELLGAYAPRAQFIVVTHQKRTMEAADSLYGVSMGADGISKVISRRLPARQAA